MRRPAREGVILGEAKTEIRGHGKGEGRLHICQKGAHLDVAEISFPRKKRGMPKIE